MSASNVKTDDSMLSRLDRALFRVESAMSLIAGIMIFGLVCLAVVHVVSRKLFNAPLPGFVDWVGVFMAVFAFLGISYCHRLGGHIRMDMLVGTLRGRRLWLAEFLTTLITLIVITALVYGTWSHFQRSFDWDAPLWSRDSSIDIGLPLWPAKLIVPFALSVLWLRLVLHLWGYGRAFIRNEETAVAVPLVEDAATQAAHEAEAMT